MVFEPFKMLQFRVSIIIFTGKNVKKPVQMKIHLFNEKKNSDTFTVKNAKKTVLIKFYFSETRWIKKTMVLS